MKRFLLSITVFCFALSFGQKPQPSLGIDVVSVTPMGDNYLKDGVKNFFGFGLTFQTVFKRNMGFGLELSQAFSEVKNKSVYGDLEKPQLTNFSAYFLYKYPFKNGLNVQGQIGAGIMRLSNQSQYVDDDYRETAAGFLLGTEISYKFPKNKIVEVFASPKIYFYNSQIKFDDSDLSRYYSRSQLLYINVGVRLNLNEK